METLGIIILSLVFIFGTFALVATSYIAIIGVTGPRRVSAQPAEKTNGQAWTKTEIN